MTIRFWTGILLMMAVTGCGSGGAPTRQNDITPLTSIRIAAQLPSLAGGTSTEITASGNFSGLFTRDISSQVVWTSDNPNVAVFIDGTNPKRVSGVAPGVATLTATKGTVTATFRLTVTSATVTGMTISPFAPSISRGVASQFSVSGSFSDATTQDLTFDAAWTSSDPAVATISNDINSKGLAQALAVGSTIISATFDGIIGTTQLTVTTPVVQSITVTTAATSLLSVSRRNFQAFGLFSDGTSKDITAQAAWSSSLPTIATVTTNVATNGVVTTLVPGTTVISASLDGVSGAANLRVTGGSLTGITLAPANSTLALGTLGRITATGTFSNGTTRVISGVVEWAVANTAIAAVAPFSGNFVRISPLTISPVQVPTTITATFGSLISPKANLTVTNPALLSIAIPPTALDLSVGTSGRFTVTGAFSDNSTQDLTDVASWSSSNAAVAAVNDTGTNKGRVSAVAAAATPVNIIASFGVKTVPSPSPATVTVRQRTLLNLAITPATTSGAAGTQVQFTVTANFSDGFIQNVTEDAALSIDKPNAAILVDDVNFRGLVGLVDAGTATMTATFGGKTQTAIITVP